MTTLAPAHAKLRAVSGPNFDPSATRFAAIHRDGCTWRVHRDRRGAGPP